MRKRNRILTLASTLWAVVFGSAMVDVVAVAETVSDKAAPRGKAVGSVDGYGGPAHCCGQP